MLAGLRTYELVVRNYEPVVVGVLLLFHGWFRRRAYREMLRVATETYEAALREFDFNDRVSLLVFAA